MASDKSNTRPLAKMPIIERTRLNIGNPLLVRLTSMAPNRPLPLVLQPAVSGLDPVAWAKDNVDFIESKLSINGAILFRGFEIDTCDDFEQFVKAVSGAPLEYRERSSPRSQVSDRVYTSTDYPADQIIFPHNEHSYARTFPLRLYFFCKRPASQGGETPLVDCRRLFRRLSAPTKDRFIQKKWMYVRNFGDGFGLPWQTVFRTDDREVVEAYCRASDIEIEWKGRDRLRTRQVRPAVIRHPRTGELSWFNHATFFNISTLPNSIQEELRMQFEEEDFPNNTYYGDGSPIEDEVLDELRASYIREAVSFTWEQGDVILLDNIIIAHARNQYTGPRQILFAMAKPYTRIDI